MYLESVNFNKKKIFKKKINLYDFFTLSEVPFLYYVSFLLLSNGNIILGSITYGYGIVRAGLVMHMLIHNAIFSNNFINKIISYFYQNILIGISVKWWRRRHNKHHNNTNISSKDPDLLTHPMIVYNKKMPNSTLTIYQIYLLPLYLSVYILLWRITSFIKCIKMGWFLDIFFSLISWVIFFSITLKKYTIFETIIIIYLSNALAGLYLGTVFMFSHFLEELKEEKEKNNVKHVMKTTINIKSNWLITYIFGGLNYQIEHHLYPNASVNKLHILNKTLRNHPLYREYSISKCFLRTYERLQDIAKYAAENNPTLTEIICEKILFLLGWKIVNKNIKIPKKCILIGYPHTTGLYDFIIFNLYFNAIKCGPKDGLKFLISFKNDKILRSYIVKKLGGIFVNKKKNAILKILDLMNKNDYVRLHIPPSGGRFKKKHLKSGFYVIGMKTKLPVMAISYDYSTKCIDRAEPLILTGNVKKDMLYFQNFYKNKTGVNDKNRTPFILPDNFNYIEE